MREGKPLQVALRCAAIIFSFGALALGEVDRDEDLPAKARAVALKFELYQETATADAIEAKRKQVLDYLGELLKQEAALANLDGALAVKALIGRLEQQAAKIGAAPGGVRPQEGLLLEEFSIESESTRRLEFRFLVARDSAAKSLRCEITGASDDSGDYGLEYELIDPRGKVVRQGFLNSSESVRVIQKTRIGGEWSLVVTDVDTVLGGEFPGNQGSLRVEVIRGQAALASNPRSR